MRVRADFDKIVHLLPDDHEWVASPLKGVDRVMLDRIGDEVAVATSIVRYAEGATFSAHEHELGEEFIVLDGEFADEHGRYSPMSYIRNPPGSHHVPFSDPGCTIFVKLRQFAKDDQRQCVEAIQTECPDTGWQVDTLHEFQGECVQIIRAAAGSHVRIAASYYCRELFVLRGSISWQTERTRRLPPWSWFRLMPGHPMRFIAEEPAVVFTKTRPHF
jgi:quercetin dioxygenase-like cupin family protein